MHPHCSRCNIIAAPFLSPSLIRARNPPSSLFLEIPARTSLRWGSHHHLWNLHDVHNKTQVSFAAPVTLSSCAARGGNFRQSSGELRSRNRSSLLEALPHLIPFQWS